MKFGSNYDALAHHWFYNNDYSECYGSRMFSERNKIFSYGRHFKIAEKVNINNNEVILITTDRYSPTTAKHVRAVENAIPSYVDTIHTPNCTRNQDEVIKYYLQEIEFWCDKESRAKSVDYSGDIKDNISTLKRFFELFPHDKRRFTKSLRTILSFDLDNNLQELVKLVSGVRNERIRVAKAKAKKLNKIAYDKQCDNLKEWLVFDRKSLYAPLLDKIYLRHNREDGTIETSNSASILVRDAKILHSLVSDGKKVLGKTIGEFTVVGAGESYTIGCTTLTRDVMNNMCKELGWKEIF